MAGYTPEIGTVQTWDRTPQVIDDIRGRLRGNAVRTTA
jgi:hypothetical protein